MEKNTREEKLKLMFGQFPEEKGFWLTSDNQGFTESNKQNGLNHSKTLEDKSFVWVDNPKLKVEITDDTADERKSLIEKYKVLFGAEPAKNIKTETLKTKIAEKEGEKN